MRHFAHKSFAKDIVPIPRIAGPSPGNQCQITKISEKRSAVIGFFHGKLRASESQELMALTTSEFAGFTFDEWVAARALMTGYAEALAQTTELFSRIAASSIGHENEHTGFSLSVESWALLSLVNEDCAARVEKVAEHFPTAFRARIDDARNGFRSMIEDGTLQSEYWREVGHNHGGDRQGR